MRHNSPVRCILCVFALIIVSFSLGMAAEALPASAAVGGCRGDPIVWLSNGMKLAMTVSLATDASQVKTILYTVHAPRGLTINQVVYTGGVLKDKERVVVLFDRPSGYVIETRADLGGTVAWMTATVTAANGQRTLSGSSASPLVFQFP